MFIQNPEQNNPQLRLAPQSVFFPWTCKSPVNWFGHFWAPRPKWLPFPLDECSTFQGPYDSFLMDERSNGMGGYLAARPIFARKPSCQSSVLGSTATPTAIGRISSPEAKEVVPVLGEVKLP